MVHDRCADCLPELRWDGVADQPPHLAKIYSPTFGSEFKVVGERLQERAFSERDRPILLGVSEPTIPEAVELSSHGRRWAIP